MIRAVGGPNLLEDLYERAVTLEDKPLPEIGEYHPIVDIEL